MSESIRWVRMGVDVEIPTDSDEVFINMKRVREIEGLEKVPHCKSLSVVSCVLDSISGLEHTPHLERLELYQNKIGRIENISHLSQLRVLDLSFNKIKVIENLEPFTKLEKLQLASNRIVTIEGLNHLSNLQELELGSNKIREVVNINNLQNLQQLWLGRNKITSMALPLLPKVQILSFQSNRLSEWDIWLFKSCPALRELYLSENNLRDPPDEIARLRDTLQILDLGKNHVSDLSSVSKLSNLTDLWLNDNDVSSLDEVRHLKDLHSLDTLYLERNPIQAKLGPGYRQAIIDILPQLNQLDALPIVKA